jgi:hypothetical protein
VVPEHDRSGLVLEAVRDLQSKDVTVLDLDPLHLVGELIERGYFGLFNQPTLTDAGAAQDILRNSEAVVECNR